jgi:polysaccharide export outer membrane protein
MVVDRVVRTLYFSILISLLWSSVGVQALHLAVPPQEAQQTRSQGDAFAMVDGNPEHRIGPNDLLHITVWNGLAVEEATVRVAEDGTIFVPFGVDQNLKAQGLSSTDLKRLIQKESLKYFRETVVQVVIEEYNSSRAYLLGEVGRGGTGGDGAGMYPLKGRQTVLEFIIEHGGFSEAANLTRVQVNRASGEVAFLNLSEVIFQGDESQNPVVNPGDIVWVPSKEVGANIYYVFGEVNAPGIVTTQENLSLVEVISRAGSFTKDASRASVYIARGDPNQPEMLLSDMKSLIQEADFSQNVAVQNNDVIYVPRRNFALFQDVVAAITPILGLLRDTVFLFGLR